MQQSSLSQELVVSFCSDKCQNTAATNATAGDVGTLVIV